jgi:serine phosphatase RsbU (regulator of sigma subunit)
MTDVREALEGGVALLTQLEAVHRLAAALHRGGSPAELYDDAVDAVVSALGVDRASLLLFDPDGVMRFKAWRGLSEGYRRAVEGHTPWKPGERGARPIVVEDVAADRDLAALGPVFKEEGVAALAFVPLLHDGGVAGKFMLYYDTPHVFEPAELAVAEILAAHASLALERRLREEALERARAEAESAAARLATLARVTAGLSEAATIEGVVGVVLGTARQELGASSGSLCLVDGDELELAYAVGYPDEVLGHWGRFPVAADLPASEAVRERRPVFVRSPQERDARYPILASTPVIPDKAFAAVPLGRPDVVGCLVLGFAEARTLNRADEAFIAELAARCGAALDRARLFSERSVIAQTLQASLLPPHLPDIPGVDVAARHVAAGRGVEVGGDFYDVFRLDASRFVVALGDVCGRGVGAASLAALCRHTVRSAVVTAADPVSILHHLNEVLLRQGADTYEPRFCTMAVAVGSVTPRGVRLDLAVGGHPLPLVRRAGGSVVAAGVPGCLLGVTPDAASEATALTLGPGDALVLVTDGVLDRRADGRVFGDDGLTRTVAACARGDAGEVATAVEAAVAAFSAQEAGDDLAVLVVAAPARSR